jgi:hypothetical protein
MLKLNLVYHAGGLSGDFGAWGLYVERVTAWLQIIGRHRGDWSVLQMPRAFEGVTQLAAEILISPD